MCKEKRIVYLAGIGMGTKEGMTVQAKESLKGCDCMIGAKRLLEVVSDADCVCHAEYLPEKIEEYLRKHPQFCRIGIVLSGDAGFYSGAKKLEEVLNGSEERYEIQRIPGISSVVYLQLRYTLPGRMQPLSASMEDGRTGFMKQNIMQKHFCCWAEEKKI